jgi:hypothetical protein
MGVVRGIDYVSFPPQGGWLGKRTEVCFKYDTTLRVLGTVVRDDRAEPHVCIIKLDDGRYVLATECQHTSPE